MGRDKDGTISRDEDGVTVVEAKRTEMEFAQDCCHHRCLTWTLGIVDKDFGLNSRIYSEGFDDPS